MRTLPSADAQFRALYEAQFDAIRAYCLRRVPIDDVNDVVSEVFLVAWRKHHSIPSGEASRLWLFGVARNVVANRSRSTRRFTALRRKATVVGTADVVGPETVVVENEAAQEAMDALAKLSERDQEIVRLRIWEELSSAEIGLVLGISAGAVDMRLSRARKKLNRLLGTAQTEGVRSRQLEGGESR